MVQNQQKKAFYSDSDERLFVTDNSGTASNNDCSSTAQCITGPPPQ
jgi:hypothetical protein